MDMTATPAITLGRSGITTAPLGVGTWAWGEQRFWGYGQEYGREDVAAAFAASVATGVTLFDTAEIYGQGESERIVGDLARQSAAPIVVATKFAPLPWRMGARTVRQALDASLNRLGMASIELYQIHFPYSLISIEALMDALADAVADGKVRAVGVSNYSAEQTKRAHEALARRGVPLATNQIQYSLLARKPEADGTLAACRALGVTVIAYSPLAQGLLTGKYLTGSTAPVGLRSWQPAFRPQRLRRLSGLLDLIKGIGEDHGGKTPAQVALNWLIQQEGVLPIPGAKTASQATSNAGALGWALRPAEVEALALASRR
ncbi:MAG TPA: aldo/keto reductase [Thermomicrobiales bacterium]|jgi:aryl-alcohol dehydrogenase-like predicted oxidoreductase